MTRIQFIEYTQFQIVHTQEILVINIHPDPHLEAALNNLANEQGIDPETLILNVLRDKFISEPQPLQPQDEWERKLLEAASDCGVALSHEDVSSEGLYD